VSQKDYNDASMAAREREEGGSSICTTVEKCAGKHDLIDGGAALDRRGGDEDFPYFFLPSGIALSLPHVPLKPRTIQKRHSAQSFGIHPYVRSNGWPFFADVDRLAMLSCVLL
jgi:hypothetical protein